MVSQTAKDDEIQALISRHFTDHNACGKLLPGTRGSARSPRTADFHRTPNAAGSWSVLHRKKSPGDGDGDGDEDSIAARLASSFPSVRSA